MKKTLTAFCLLIMAVLAHCASITVTSPSSGDFLGRTNQLNFTITGSHAQARVKVVTTYIADPTVKFTNQRDFNPNVDNQISGSIPLNFDQATPEGLYRIDVTVTEPGTTYVPVVINNITIDVNDPELIDFSPGSNSFVRGVVPIRARIDENNVDLWTVQVNGQDIPNNTGSTTSVSVDWSTNAITNDGSQNISIKVDDKARNSTTQNISVTLDRIRPSISILSPTSTPYRPGVIIPVVVDITDQFTSAVLAQNVDVLIKDMSDRILGRVARLTANASGPTLQWTGRIKNTNTLPGQFKVVVTAADRAGNPAITQTVIVKLQGRAPSSGG